jgi:hypothetical protein
MVGGTGTARRGISSANLTSLKNKFLLSPIQKHIVVEVEKLLQPDHNKTRF